MMVHNRSEKKILTLVIFLQKSSSGTNGQFRLLPNSGQERWKFPQVKATGNFAMEKIFDFVVGI